jgi:gamma-glutamylcyclotransferase (GGCT)/AIG2-like uncharacterized protein YtfP
VGRRKLQHAVMGGEDPSERGVGLFSYGTLRQREVQLANYGRELDGSPDVLSGYRLEQLVIDRPDVMEISRKSVHTIARRSGDPADRIPGMLFVLTEGELGATDAYETSAYRRIEVTLESGRTAWVYVARTD